jgi:hypothetical protein
MSGVFGAIDLFSGSSSITGTNLFQVDKNPLNQLDEGIEDVIGKQAQSSGGQIISIIETMLEQILGIPNGTLPDLGTMFGNIEQFLGNLNPLDPNFAANIVTAAETFITDILKPTNLVALLVGNANNSAGVTGFIPLENLAIDLLAGIIGGAQSVIDAILGAIGIPAGSGTEQMVTQLFNQLFQMLGNPLFGSTFNPVTSVENFITTMLAPTGLLAPLQGGFVPILNIPPLDTSKITSGVFANSFVPGLQQIWTSITGQSNATPNTLTTYFNNLESMLGLPALPSSSFNPATAVQTFVTDMLMPTQMVAPLVSDASTVISGLTGYIPMNLIDTTLLSTVVGGGQQIIDAILGTVGIPAGSGTPAQVNTYFSQLLQMLGTPALTSSTFNPVTEVENFITEMIAPTGLLAPLQGGFVPVLNIPPLDTSKITSGVFANSFVPGLGQTWNAIVQSMGGASTGNTITNVITALENIPGVNIVSTLLATVIPGLDATKIITGVLSSSTIPDITRAMSSDMQLMLDNAWAASFGHTTERAFAAMVAAPSGGAGPQTFGNELTFNVAGQIIQLWFYRYDPTYTTTSRTLRIFNTSGTQLASVTTTETVGQSGWVSATLATPFPVVSGQTLWVSYDATPGERYMGQGAYASEIADITWVTGGYTNTYGTVPNQNPWANNSWTDVTFAPVAGSGHSAGDFYTALTSIPGANIVSTLAAAVIPALDATKIVTGVLAVAQIPTGSLGAGNIADIQHIIDYIYQATHTGSGATGNPVTSVLSSLQNIPGVNIISAIAASVVPSLPAGWGKTIDGSLLIGNIAAGLISGALSNASLAASALTSGAIPAGITMAGSALSSAISAANVPSLPAGWGKTIDGSLLIGNVAASLVNGALSNASLAASALTSRACPPGGAKPSTAPCWPGPSRVRSSTGR